MNYRKSQNKTEGAKQKFYNISVPLPEPENKECQSKIKEFMIK